MPWSVEKAGDRCPEGKPFAVVRSDTGALVACHDTESSAHAQVRASGGGGASRMQA